MNDDVMKENRKCTEELRPDRREPERERWRGGAVVVCQECDSKGHEFDPALDAFDDDEFAFDRGG
ncbi:hypothetical protein PRIPAC_95208 [Pristionchus pacificus]|uniref:Uncharacterized protein n=1 Tax=Pristionchus pacificus TaxID=54126 RepID=A0A2A6BIU3_PRIPA|nr:hypothetical protein PRIPAC_95208 [Pristionchus pacificus]|eukprot:PDM65830.1 hypothetical protein PRIPAC_45231 [Pristionchus pacificus]